MAILTAEQIEELRQILRDASTAVAISTTGLEVGREEMARLVAEGYVDPDQVGDIVLDGFEYGQIMQRDPSSKDMSYLQFRRSIEREPVQLSAAEQKAVEIARTRAGQFCVGLGTRYSGEVGTQVIKLDQQLATQQLVGIREAVSQSIAYRGTISQLKSELGRIAEDWARDWHRIAITETHLAHQQGFYEATVEQFGGEAMMAKIPEPTACEACKSLYLGPDGRPIVRPASWWNDQGIANVGLKKKQWKPALGSVHPHCQCQLVRVPEGMGFDDNMDLMPLDMIKSLRKGSIRVVRRDQHGREHEISPPGTIHNWKTGRHQKQADGTWKRLSDGLKKIEQAKKRVTEGDRQPLTRRPPAIKIPEKIKDALDRGAYLVINSSGGKDSQAITYMLASSPELAKYKDKMIVLHADLGRAEWPGGGEHAEKMAKEYGLPFHVTRRDAWINPETGKKERWLGDMMTHFEQRAAWPGMYRICTSDMKTGPCWKWIRNNLSKKGVPVISALGIRKEEGEHDKTSGGSRWFAEEWGTTKEFGVQGGKPREAYEWNPILDWKLDDVWNGIRESGLDRHYAYDLGSSRLSCMFCHLANQKDLLTAARANPKALDEWIAAENRMRDEHNRRREFWARQIDKHNEAGTYEVVNTKHILRGAAGPGEMRKMGGKKTKGGDIEIPKRYLQPFQEFKKGFTLADLKKKLLAETAKSVGGGSLEAYVNMHAKGIKKYAELVFRADRLREQASNADVDGRERLLRERSKLLDQVAAIGRVLAGSHPFPTRGEGLTESIKKSRKLHYRTQFAGLPISIENRRGSYRHWYDKATETHGKTFMKLPYGYIRLTEGADGDHVDCFLGPDQEAPSVYVVHQLRAPHFRTYDEDKVMLGFRTKSEAKKAYLAHFDTPEFFGSITTIPIERFREQVFDGSYRSGQKIMKSKITVIRRDGSVWEPIPHGKRGGVRKKKAGGGYDYKYPRYPVEAPARAGRILIDRAQQDANKRAAHSSVASTSMIYLNVSGGGEKRMFAPSDPAKISGLAGRNLGIQITAHEIPKTPKGIERFAQHARREGLKLMVDSGEFPRFVAQGKIDAGKKVSDTVKKRAALDFDTVMYQYGTLAGAMPSGTLTVVAPDRIADGEKTAELRAKYAPQIRALMDKGVGVIVPLQARTTEGLVADYMRAADHFGDRFVIGIPMAKKPMPMEELLPFMTTLYEQGRAPKVHMLGGSEPVKMARQTSQLVAACYLASRGVPRERVLEMTKTGESALKALANIKTQADVLTSEADSALYDRMMSWARERGLDPDHEDFDDTEHWLDFFDDHPEEFDLDIEDKAAHIRGLANRLVQFDTTTAAKAVQYKAEHALSGEQVPVTGHHAETEKKDRYLEALEKYLQAREYQHEVHTPHHASGYYSLGKADYGGVSGAQPGKQATVGHMSMHSAPARSPGDDPYVAQMQEEHPGNETQRKKRKKKRRSKEPESKKKRMKLTGKTLRDVEGHARGREIYHEPLLEEPVRNAERNRDFFEDEAKRRTEVGRRATKLSIRPGELR